jgi:WXG100 family type VII secretion target
MTEILLKGTDARDYAAEIKRAAEDADATIRSLTARLNSLSDSFRGAAQQKFEEKYTEWSSGQNKAKEALQDLAQWLEQAAEKIEDIDAQLAQGLG